MISLKTKLFLICLFFSSMVFAQNPTEKKPSYVCGAFGGDLQLQLKKVFLWNKFGAYLYGNTGNDVIPIATGECLKVKGTQNYSCKMSQIGNHAVIHSNGVFNPSILDENKRFELALTLSNNKVISMSCFAP